MPTLSVDGVQAAAGDLDMEPVSVEEVTAVDGVIAFMRPVFPEEPWAMGIRPLIQFLVSGARMREHI
jgi:hypothetical protein